MRILIACEFSGVVRDAFIKRGHDAISCDLLPSLTPGPHYQGDVFCIIDKGFDMMIAHPPCTYLCTSGNRWMKDNPERAIRRMKAIKFFMGLYDQKNIPRIAIENPVGIMSTHFRKPDQYVQPYFFGKPESKKTGLWLKNLPLLEPTNMVEPVYIIGKDGKRYSPTHYLCMWSSKKFYSNSRENVRSLTPIEMAEAMAEQWSGL